MSALLIFGAFCLGILLGHRDALKKRRGWKEYRPSTNPLRDFR